MEENINNQDPKYAKNVYNALKSKVDGFNKSEEEFMNSLSDPNYVKNVHNALSKKVDGFNKSYDEFSSLVSEKKKKNSSSTSPGQNLESETQNGSSASKSSFDEIAKQYNFSDKEKPTNYKENKIESKSNSNKDLESFQINKTQQDLKTDPGVVSYENKDKVAAERKQKLSEISQGFDDALVIDGEDEMISDLKIEANDLANFNGSFASKLESGAKNIYNKIASVFTDNEDVKFSYEQLNPLGEQIKLAKEQLKGSDDEFNFEKIQELAKQIYVEQKVQDKKLSLANDFLDNLPNEDKKLLELDRLSKLETINFKDKTLLKGLKVYDLKIEDLGNKLKELYELSKEQELDQDQINQSKDLAEKFKKVVSERVQTYDEFTKNNDELGSAEEEYDILRRENNAYLNSIEKVRIGFSKMGVGFAQFANMTTGQIIGSKEDNDKIKDQLSFANEYLDGESNTLQKETQEVHSINDVIDYTTDLISNQAPNLALMYATGGTSNILPLASIASYSTGQKFTELYTSNKKGETNYTAPQMYLAAIMSGGAEAIESNTLKMLGGGKRVLTSTLKNETSRELFKKSIAQKVKQGFSAYTKNVKGEILEEETTNLVQNFTDKYILGKDVGLFDNSIKVMKDAAAMSTILSGFPQVAGAALKPFVPKNYVQELDANSKKIEELSKILMTENIDAKTKETTEKILAEKSNNIEKILTGVIDHNTTLSDEAINKVVDLEIETSYQRATANSIKNDKSISKDQKETLLKEIETEYKKNEDFREKIVSGNSTALDFLSEKEVTRLKEKASRELVKEAETEGKKEASFDDKQITEKALELYDLKTKKESAQSVEKTVDNTIQSAENIDKKVGDQTNIKSNETTQTDNNSTNGDIRPGIRENIDTKQTDTEVQNENVQAAIEPTTSKKPIEIKVSENGPAYSISNKDGIFRITDKEGKSPSKPTTKKILEKYSETINFTKGEAVSDTPNTSAETYLDDVAERSKKPSEIAEAITFSQNNDFNEGLDPVTSAIASIIGEKSIEKSSFTKFGDRNNINQSIALQYFANKGEGKGIDQIAMEVEEAVFGDYNANSPRVSEQDVIDFILDNPGGSKKFLNSNKKDKLDKLKSAFTDVTGLPATDNFIQKAIKQMSEKTSRLNNEEVLYAYTDEQLLSLDNDYQQFSKQKNGKEKTNTSNERGVDSKNQKERREESGVQEPRGKSVKQKQEKLNIEEKLFQLNKSVFGLNDKKAKASAAIIEKTIETISERSSKSKEEVFNSIYFEKASEDTIQSLTKNSKVLFQIIGKNAKISNEVRGFLKEAQSLEKLGSDAKEIFLKTGWEKGKDGKWRYEILDTNATVINDNRGPLSEVMDYPELFEKYPKAKDIEIIFDPYMNIEGQYDSSKNRIRVNNSGTKEETKLTLLHEIQHWIQNKEGFSGGASSTYVKQKLEEKIKKEKNSFIKKGLNSFYSLVLKNKNDLASKELSKLESLLSKDDFELYESVVGEVEARNVEKRSTLTEEERKITPLYETEDIAREDQIVLFQGEQGAMLAEDGKFIIYALTDPNVSTPLHEMAHIYEHYLTSSERNTILDNAEHTEWTRETSEFFAKGFEKYLADGIAPDPKMKELFENFKKWLENIYNGIINSEIDITLSKEMQSIYDTMLGFDTKNKVENIAYSEDIQDGVLDFLDSLKLDLNNTNATLPFLPQTWNLFIDAVKVAYKGGVSLVEAIEAAKAKLKAKGISDVEISKITDYYNELASKNKPESFTNKSGQRSLLQRLNNGGNPKVVLDAINSIGLNYEKLNHEKTFADAVNFVKKVGTAEAYNAIKDGKIKSAAAVTVIYSEILEKLPAEIDNALSLITDESKIIEAQNEYQKLYEEILEKYSSRATELGQANSILNYIYNQNQAIKYSLSKQIEAHKTISNGVVDQATKDKLKELDDKYKKAVSRIKELEENNALLEAKQALDNIIESEKRKQNISNKRPNSAQAKRIANTVRKLKINKPGIFKSSTGADIVWDGAVELVAKSIETTGKVADSIQKGLDFIKKSEWFKNLSKSDKQLAENEFMNSFDEVYDSNEVDQNISITKDGEVKISSSLLTNFIKQGGTDINELVSTIKNEIEAEFPNISEREIRDAITGYGKRVNKTRSQLQNDISRLKNLGKLESELEDVKKGIAKQKGSPNYRRKLSDREIALKKQIKAIQDDLGITEQTRTERSKAYTKKRIEELKKKIETEDVAKKEIKPIQEDAELKALRIEKNRLQEDFDKLKHRKELEQRTLTDKIRDHFSDLWDSQRVTRATGELSFVGAQGGFYVIDGLLSRKTLKNLVKNIKGTTTNDWKPRNILKTLSKISKSAQSVNAIAEMFDKMGTKNNYDDFENILKEHPHYDTFIKAKLRILGEDAKTQVKDEMFIGNAILSILRLPAEGLTYLDKGKKRTTLQGYIEKLKTGEVSDKNKKTFSEMTGPLTATAALERGNNTFMNIARIDLFMRGVSLLEMQGKNAIDNIDDYKKLASAVNTVTGSANLSQTMTMAVPILNKLIFSTRYWASSLNMTPPISMYYLWKLGDYDGVFLDKPKTWKKALEVNVAQKTFLRSTIKGMTSMYGMATYILYLINADKDEEEEKAYIEYDPRSSDFMQIVDKNTRTDMFGPYRNNVVLFSRLLTRESKNKKGEIISNGEGIFSRTNKDIFFDYVSNKANPFPGMFLRNAAGKKVEVKNEETGEKEEKIMLYEDNVAIENQFLNNLYPIFVDTTIDLVNEDPQLGAEFYVMLSFIGKQSSVYGSDKNKKKKGE